MNSTTHLIDFKSIFFYFFIKNVVFTYVYCRLKINIKKNKYNLSDDGVFFHKCYQI